MRVPDQAGRVLSPAKLTKIDEAIGHAKAALAIHESLADEVGLALWALTEVRATGRISPSLKPILDAWIAAHRSLS